MNNPKQRSRGRGNNGGNPNRISHGGGHGGHSGGGGGGGHPRNINIRSQVFDSNGPEGRIRGNAHQVMEKYLALARDAASQGDRHAAENFYQHAEHYFRLINAYNQNNGQRRPQNLPTPAEDQADLGAEDDEGEERGASAAPEMDADNEPAAAQVAEAPAPRAEPAAAEVPAEAAPNAAPPDTAAPEAEAPARPARRRRRPAAETAEAAAAEAEPVLI